jgi:hypothetical protein
MLERIKTIAKGVERSLFTRRLTAANLAVRSRRGYQWLKYLSDPETLANHLKALQQLDLILEKERGRARIRVRIKLYHQGSLYKVQQKGKYLDMVAQESFLTAPDEILEALVNVALDPSNLPERKALRDYAFSEEYQKIRKKLEYLGIPAGSFAIGDVHHLENCFHRVNQEYFQGRMDKPHLVWSQRLTHRKFGHYQWETDTVMVSRSLDDQRIPEMVVDFVIYHELLHKKIGFKQTNQNRIAHSPEFRLAEEQFQNVKEARHYLNHLSKKKARP